MKTILGVELVPVKDVDQFYKPINYQKAGLLRILHLRQMRLQATMMCQKGKWIGGIIIGDCV